MNLKFHSTDSFKLEVGEFLSSRNISLEDVDDIVVMVKAKFSDTDANARATLTLGSGVSKDVANNAIYFNFDYTDFGPGLLESGKCYKIGIGFKTPSITKYLEPDLKDNTLNIEPDFIHD